MCRYRMYDSFKMAVFNKFVRWAKLVLYNKTSAQGECPTALSSVIVFWPS